MNNLKTQTMLVLSTAHVRRDPQRTRRCLMKRDHAMVESLLEQLHFIQEALASHGDRPCSMCDSDAGVWLDDGADFEALPDGVDLESVAHAVGFINGVAFAFDMTIAELLDMHSLFDPRERATQMKLAEARVEKRRAREAAREIAANVATAPLNKQGVRDLSRVPAQTKRAGGGAS